ncbi:MAG: zf-HC2 domain-containing protein [Planctomycetes bacterium]|nr:zf-HC2 domain-containing protein [Planctomycetota bacterium]
MSPFRPDDLCEWFRERLELFLDGELSGSESFRFQQHLKECEDCARHWAGDEVVAEELLLALAPELDPGQLLPRDEHRPRIPRVGEERPVGHHSTTVVVERGRHLVPTLLAGLAAALLLVFGLRNGQGTRQPAPGRALAVVESRPAGTRIYPQGQVELRAAGGDWRPLVAADEIVAGVEIRARRDSLVLVDLGTGDHFVLGENSTGRLDGLDGVLRIELDGGHFSCDLRGRGLELRSLGLELAGDDLACDLRAERDGAREDGLRVSVIRGSVVARAELGGCRRLDEGDVYGLRDGMLVAFDRPEGEVGEARLAVKSRIDLGVRLEEAPTDMVGGRAGLVGLPLGSVRARIERWLDRVVADGGLNIVDPDRASRAMMEQVASRGDEALSEIEALFAEAGPPLARRALLGLVSSIPGAGARDFLIAAARDSDLRVRKASLLILSRRGEAELGSHFVAVMKREQDSDLRLSAAFLAAALGEGEGFEEMCRIHDQAPSVDWRQTVVQLVTRLEVGHAGREDFLHRALAEIDGSAGLAIFDGLVRALEAEGDPVRLERALRRLLGRQDLVPALRNAIECTLDSL